MGSICSSTDYTIVAPIEPIRINPLDGHNVLKHQAKETEIIQVKSCLKKETFNDTAKEEKVVKINVNKMPDGHKSESNRAYTPEELCRAGLIIVERFIPYTKGYALFFLRYYMIELSKPLEEIPSQHEIEEVIKDMNSTMTNFPQLANEPRIIKARTYLKKLKDICYAEDNMPNACSDDMHDENIQCHKLERIHAEQKKLLG